MKEPEGRVIYVRSKKMEFSQKWLLGCIFFTVLFTALSYVLSYLDKNPLEALSSQIIQCMCTVDGFSFIGYTVQNAVRAYCTDKYLKGGNDNG